MQRLFLVAILVLALVAPSGSPLAGPEPEELIQALAAVPEDHLLDVGIRILDPGVDHDQTEEALEALEKAGIFPYLRRSEARWIPYELKKVLELSGFWGAVRIVPGDESAVDVMVEGEIVKSNGKYLVLMIRARDATGKHWIKNKKYKAVADTRAYADESDEEIRTVTEPYREMYNEIANDLLRDLKKRDTEEISAIRWVTLLRFAGDVAPDAFREHLSSNDKGRYKVERLPAEDDPMLVRVGRVREADYEFIDTLNEYYADFSRDMDEPYDLWRAYSYEEQQALEKARRKARNRSIFGALLIFAGIAADGSNGDVTQAAGEAAVIAGGLIIASSVAKFADIKSHKESIRELAGSLDAEVEPILDEVEGRTLKLSGSAEAQYAKFRELLREIFAAETGLPAERGADTVAGSDP